MKITFSRRFRAPGALLAISLLVRVSGAAGNETLWEASYHLYRDVAREQSDLAHQALGQAYSGHRRLAGKSLEAMQAMETARHLPPLSYLLSVAVDVMRYQNGDFENESEEKLLLRSIESASDQGLAQCRLALEKEPNHPTYLLIMGGIRGFLATLKIPTHPSQAMGDGFQALKLLEKSREVDGTVKDSYMGTGIFHSTAANAPLFVRATLKIMGRSVNMRAGLEALRISAYQGQYTSVASQLFLLQFLSPYDEEPKREKRQIFRTLEGTFSRNPYYTFLKMDEALCFYPDSFYSAETRQELASRIAAAVSTDFHTRRYANLIRYQYTLLDPQPDHRQAPDSSFQFRDFAFYPVFVEALRYRRQAEESLMVDGTAPEPAAAALKQWKDSCLTMIGGSPMNPARKRYYHWHVSDALRWPPKREAPRQPPAESITGTQRP